MAQQDNINVNGLSLTVWDMQSTAQQIDDAVSVVLEWQEDTNNPGCYYHMVGGVQEWINPPMQLGVEYRTTKRSNGVPVYKQLANWGSLPNNTTKSGSLGITGLDGLVSCQLQFANLNDLIPWDNSNSDQSVKVNYISPYNLGTISVTTNYDASGSQMWATIEYTKSS